MYIFEFFCPRDKYVTSKAGDAKKIVCWLPIRTPITWEDSRNFTAHLKNSKAGMERLASLLLTPGTPGKGSRSRVTNSTAGHYTLEKCTELLL